MISKTRRLHSGFRLYGTTLVKYLQKYPSNTTQFQVFRVICASMQLIYLEQTCEFVRNYTFFDPFHEYILQKQAFSAVHIPNWLQLLETKSLDTSTNKYNSIDHTSKKNHPQPQSNINVDVSHQDITTFQPRYASCCHLAHIFDSKLNTFHDSHSSTQPPITYSNGNNHIILDSIVSFDDMADKLCHLSRFIQKQSHEFTKQQMMLFPSLQIRNFGVNSNIHQQDPEDTQNLQLYLYYQLLSKCHSIIEYVKGYLDTNYQILLQNLTIESIIEKKSQTKTDRNTKDDNDHIDTYPNNLRYISEFFATLREVESITTPHCGLTNLTSINTTNSISTIQPHADNALPSPHISLSDLYSLQSIFFPLLFLQRSLKTTAISFFQQTLRQRTERGHTHRDYNYDYYLFGNFSFWSDFSLSFEKNILQNPSKFSHRFSLQQQQLQQQRHQLHQQSQQNQQKQQQPQQLISLSQLRNYALLGADISKDMSHISTTIMRSFLETTEIRRGSPVRNNYFPLTPSFYLDDFVVISNQELLKFIFSSQDQPDPHASTTTKISTSLHPEMFGFSPETLYCNLNWIHPKQLTSASTSTYSHTLAYVPIFRAKIDNSLALVDHTQFTIVGPVRFFYSSYSNIEIPARYAGDANKPKKANTTQQTPQSILISLLTSYNDIHQTYGYQQQRDHIMTKSPPNLSFITSPLAVNILSSYYSYFCNSKSLLSSSILLPSIHTSKPVPVESAFTLISHFSTIFPTLKIHLSHPQLTTHARRGLDQSNQSGIMPSLSSIIPESPLSCRKQSDALTSGCVYTLYSPPRTSKTTHLQRIHSFQMQAIDIRDEYSHDELNGQYEQDNPGNSANIDLSHMKYHTTTTGKNVNNNTITSSVSHRLYHTPLHIPFPVLSTFLDKNMISHSFLKESPRLKHLHKNNNHIKLTTFLRSYFHTTLTTFNCGLFPTTIATSSTITCEITQTQASSPHAIGTTITTVAIWLWILPHLPNFTSEVTEVSEVAKGSQWQYEQESSIKLDVITHIPILLSLATVIVEPEVIYNSSDMSYKPSYFGYKYSLSSQNILECITALSLPTNLHPTQQEEYNFTKMPQNVEYAIELLLDQDIDALIAFVYNQPRAKIQANHTDYSRRNIDDTDAMDNISSTNISNSVLYYEQELYFQQHELKIEQSIQEGTFTKKETIFDFTLQPMLYSHQKQDGLNLQPLLRLHVTLPLNIALLCFHTNEFFISCSGIPTISSSISPLQNLTEYIQGKNTPRYKEVVDGLISSINAPRVDKPAQHRDFVNNSSILINHNNPTNSIDPWFFIRTGVLIHSLFYSSDATTNSKLVQCVSQSSQLSQSSLSSQPPQLPVQSPSFIDSISSRLNIKPQHRQTYGTHQPSNKYISTYSLGEFTTLFSEQAHLHLFRHLFPFYHNVALLQWMKPKYTFKSAINHQSKSMGRLTAEAATRSTTRSLARLGETRTVMKSLQTTKYTATVEYKGYRKLHHTFFILNNILQTIVNHFTDYLLDMKTISEQNIHLNGSHESNSFGVIGNTATINSPTSFNYQKCIQNALDGCFAYDLPISMLLSKLTKLNSHFCSEIHQIFYKQYQEDYEQTKQKNQKQTLLFYKSKPFIQDKNVFADTAKYIDNMSSIYQINANIWIQIEFLSTQALHSLHQILLSLCIIMNKRREYYDNDFSYDSNNHKIGLNDHTLSAAATNELQKRLLIPLPITSNSHLEALYQKLDQGGYLSNVVLKLLDGK